MLLNIKAGNLVDERVVSWVIPVPRPHTNDDGRSTELEVGAGGDLLDILLSSLSPSLGDGSI